jgi:excisionase family DNA binding protein
MTTGITLNELIDDVANRVADVLASREPVPEPATPWFTVEQAADYMQMSPDAIRASEKRGQLKAHRSETGRVRFLKSDLDAFLGSAA